MSTTTTTTSNSSPTETTTGPITVKHVESIKTVAVDQFPAIEIGHEIYASRGRRNKNWKGFFAELPLGGVFTVTGGQKEAQLYYMNGRNRNITLSRKTMPGGGIRIDARCLTSKS